MKIHVDDWHFRSVEKDLLVLDLFLENGQHAMLHVKPLIPPGNELIVPEMIAFCELPGEKLGESGGAPRWVSRPPSRDCPWSHVELPQALAKQIQEKFGNDVTVAAISSVET